MRKIYSLLQKTGQIKNLSLTIATTHTQAKYFLPKAILKIRQQLPDLKLRIEQSNPNTLITMLEKHQADIAICTEQIGGREHLNYMPCYQWRHCIILPLGHPLSKQQEVSLDTVANYPIVTYVYGFTGRTAIQRGFREINRQPRVILSASDSDVIKTYVRIGFGVGIIAQMAYQEEDQKDLLAIPIKESDIESSETGLAWLHNRYFNNTMQQAIKILVEYGDNFYQSIIKC